MLLLKTYDIHYSKYDAPSYLIASLFFLGIAGIGILILACLGLHKFCLYVKEKWDTVDIELESVPKAANVPNVLNASDTTQGEQQWFVSQQIHAPYSEVQSFKMIKYPSNIIDQV